MLLALILVGAKMLFLVLGIEKAKYFGFFHLEVFSEISAIRHEKVLKNTTKLNSESYLAFIKKPKNKLHFST